MRLPCLVLGLGLFATAARAEEIKGATPQSMAFEVKLGLHKPFIDRDPNLTTDPYYDMFGNYPMVMAEFEFDYQFWRPLDLGSLAASFSFGYGEKFAKAIDAATGAAAEESAGLRLVPFKAMLVARFDWAANKHNIPLVPFVKGGAVGEIFWFVKNNKVEVVNGVPGQGIRWGLTGALGLMLQIDFLDPQLARDFDTSAGVNHSYLFAEWQVNEVANFGMLDPVTSKPGLDLSNRTFMFGLGFEF